MAELKTKLNNKSVTKFLDSVNDEKKRKDCYAILEVMQKVTKEEPKMWGDSIIGFGSYHYKYESGRERDWFLAGISPRKQNISVYLMGGFRLFDDLLKKLGKYKASKGCLYINSFEDIDQKVFKELVTKSVKKLTGKK
jgi:hypothetical protein